MDARNTAVTGSYWAITNPQHQAFQSIGPLVSALLSESTVGLSASYAISLKNRVTEQRSVMHSMGNDDATAFNEIRLEWEEIARAEVTRHRRRLGLLTPEQQSAVESVLISVADHMFETVLQGAANCSGGERLRYLSVWRRQAA
jgi:hypothetical protein